MTLTSYGRIQRFVKTREGANGLPLKLPMHPTLKVARFKPVQHVLYMHSKVFDAFIRKV